VQVCHNKANRWCHDGAIFYFHNFSWPRPPEL
jgi:hypothetical protein